MESSGQSGVRWRDIPQASESESSDSDEHNSAFLNATATTPARQPEDVSPLRRNIEQRLENLEVVDITDEELENMQQRI